ncbi:MAG: hypothetical protein NC548_10680 [Lachnospiraceae bacterium]|nr:hypothetical protein [Lachnospiraceae bacterium]
MVELPYNKSVELFVNNAKLSAELRRLHCNTMGDVLHLPFIKLMRSKVVLREWNSLVNALTPLLSKFPKD